MIVQRAPEGEPRFVILQTDHTQASGQFADAYGNADFIRTPQHDLLAYVAAHHDEGWRDVDAGQTLDPATGFPYHLTQTPTAQLIASGTGSPDFNEARHPFCGLISSMHTYGLYHGRYGLSDKVYIDSIAPELRPRVDAMLAHELARQARLKAELDADPQTLGWSDDALCFHHYKLLQFFDTLALYVQMTRFDLLEPTTFSNVPRALGDDVTISARPIAPHTVALAPFPFAGDALETTTSGRYLTRQDVGTDWRALYDAQPVAVQTVRLVAD